MNMKTIIKPLLTVAFICFLAIFTNAQSIATKTNPGSTVLTETIKFHYGGELRTHKLSFNVSDYNYYKKLGKKEFEPDYAIYAREASGHAYIETMAKSLATEAKKLGLEGTDLVEYLVAFVQEGIPYVTDPDNGGYDYPRFPIETIVDGKGDCEDKAALLASILNVYGYDAVLLSPPGHMAVGIRCEDCEEGTYELDGNKYIYVETTVKGWPIGIVPPQFESYGEIEVYKP
jgi:transglutaminase-like putative cysteine protease